jgi:hypothetical protein
MMPVLKEDGFRVGDIYSLKDGNTTELIPRHAISYVSAKYESRPAYLLAGILFLGYGIYAAYDQSVLAAAEWLVGTNEALGIWGAIVIGVLLVMAYFSSRRVGIVVSSSGGRLFVETRGRNRLQLLDRIFADLERHAATTGHPNGGPGPHVPEALPPEP